MKKFLFFFILSIILVFYIYCLTLPHPSITIDLASTTRFNKLYNNKLAPRFIWLFLFNY